MLRIVEVGGSSTAYATRLFAELGHDVVCVEDPRGGPVRRRGPFVGTTADLDHGAHHQFFNAGKRSLSLDAAAPGAEAVILRLAAWADLLVVDGARSVDVEAVGLANPNLALVLVPDGEESELVLAARSGLLRLTGHPGRSPTVLGGSGVIHAVAGAFVAIAASAAVVGGRVSGHGVRVEVSARECLTSLTEQAMITYLTEGEVADRVGIRGVVTGVSGAFPARDGHWVLSVPSTPEAWESFMEWIQDPALVADHALVDEGERRDRSDFIRSRLVAWSAERDRDEIVREGQTHRIPTTPVLTALDLAENVQLLARGFLREQEYGLLGDGPIPVGALATLKGESLRPAPRLGEHNAQILRDLGYSHEDQEALVQAGIV